MSKAKLRGAVGYSCYIRPSLQHTSLSTLKPGKLANEQGSYIPLDYQRTIPRASTAPAGAKRTIQQRMSNEIAPESFEELYRPNPDEDARKLQKEMNKQFHASAAHWKSVHVDTFQGNFGQPGSPNTNVRADMSPVGSPREERKSSEQGVLEIARKSAADRIQVLAKRPQTHHMGVRPRHGSRQGNLTLRGKHKGDVVGTSQGTIGQIPGYSGFIPQSDTNTHAKSQADLGSERADMKDTLFASYRRVVPGYKGFQPRSVHNNRSFKAGGDGTSYGAVNSSMLRYCRGLSRPEAGGESLIIKNMFTAPLNGRPSDNGLTNAQQFYARIRPYEGLPRVHYPNQRHQSGCKFPSSSVASMADSGANLPIGRMGAAA